MSEYDHTFRRDIKTSNPRKFFRLVKNTIRDMDYQIKDDKDNINIQQDAVGNVGVINGSLEAKSKKVKEIPYKERSLSLLQAIIVILVGAGLSVFNRDLLIFSILIIIGGIFGFLNNNEKVREESYIKEIEIKSEGEVYSGKKEEKDMEESKVISELTILIKGRTTNGDEITKDIDKLKDFVSTFSEE